MAYAFVTTNLTDLRADPDHHSERSHQVRFGEVVKIGARKHGFARVTQADGYSGWVDWGFLQPAPETKRRRGKTMVVLALTAPVFDDKGHPTAPHFVYYGTVVRVIGRRGTRSVCERHDGLRFHIATRSLDKPGFKSKRGSATQLVREAKRFLGVPYLWGGISPAGFDCSGFVQTLFARFGVALPRDTKDQISAGVEIDAANVRPADLLFFRRHVGIALSGGRLIHASRGGGGVRVNSLCPSDDTYRKDLHDTFAMARRVL